MVRTALSHDVPAERMRDLHSTAVLGLVSEVVVGVLNAAAPVIEHYLTGDLGAHG